MEIRSIHIDIDKDIFMINGKEYNRKTIVELPSSIDGWSLKKLFGNDGNTETPCDRLTVVLDMDQ